jgi:hypothetical protein
MVLALDCPTIRPARIRGGGDTHRIAGIHGNLPSLSE